MLPLYEFMVPLYSLQGKEVTKTLLFYLMLWVHPWIFVGPSYQS